jgi:hypothetical protein
MEDYVKISLTLFVEFRYLLNKKWIEIELLLLELSVVLRPDGLEHGDNNVVGVEHQIVKLGVEEGLVIGVQLVEEGNLSALFGVGHTVLQSTVGTFDLDQ